MGVHLQPFTSESRVLSSKTSLCEFSEKPEQRTQCLALEIKLGTEKRALVLFSIVYFLIHFAV